MENKDRISELYLGKLWGEEQQRRARERIHWMCSRATGERVLDMGCSQGIVSILLGREGRRVLGVDIRPDAIEYAAGELEQEPPEVRSRVEFKVGDAAALEVPETGFDNVVLGEILEHQTDPDRLLSAAVRLLRPGGQAVITVPFGLHPDPDHKITFYLTNLVELVSGHLRIDELTIQNKYIFCTAARPEDESQLEQNAAWKNGNRRMLEMTEAAMDQAENEHLKQHRYSLSRAEKADREVERLHKQINSEKMKAKAELEKERADRKQSAARLKQQEQALDLAEKSAAKLRSEIENLRAREEAGKQELTQARQDLSRTKSDLENARREADRQKEAVRSLETKVAGLEAQVTEQNRLRWRLADLEKRLKEKNIRLKETEAERDKLLNEVRYRLGDALVSAYYQPTQLPKLPLKIGSLFAEGFGRHLARIKKYGGQKFLPRKVTISNPAPTPQANPVAQPATVIENRATDCRPRVVPAQTTPIPVKPRRPDVRAAAVMDEFSMACFRHECDLVPVGKGGWKNEIPGLRPDFLFVESAWHGNLDDWQYEVVSLEKRPQGELRKLVVWCREQGIPTVFWNKEDPINYHLFIEAAKLFEFVFTTDENRIPRYREDLGHDRVWALPFAAQPAIHNPIAQSGVRNSEGNVAFAGAWYSNRHPDRMRDMHNMLRPALRHGLHIFDRFADYTKSDAYRFPEEYQIAIRGSRSYQQMLDLYRRYKVFLNVNSVQDSPTMFSRRVLELLAAGTCVLSGYSLGIDKMLGTELVPMVKNAEETGRWLEVLLNNDEMRERMVHRGMRKVLTEHTYAKRLDTILEKTGIAPVVPTRQKVSVITCTNRPNMLDNILDNYQRQLHPDRELILVLNDDSMSQEAVAKAVAERGIQDAQVLKLPAENTLGECLNAAIDRATGDFIAKCDDDDFYGDHYLSDALLPFDYSEASLVGKYTYYAYLEEQGALGIRYRGHENRYMDFICGGTMVIKREVLDQIRFEKRNRGEDTQFLKDCKAAGFRIYAADRFNFVQTRRGGGAGEHSWEMEDSEYLRKCEVIAYTKDFSSNVVV